MFPRAFARLVGLSLLSLLFSPVDAVAETVIKFELAGMTTERDIQFDTGTLSTIDDGEASTVGEQSTNVSYQDFLGGLTDIAAGASMTISGVDKLGDALDANGIVTQVTSGGTFFLYDDSNFLLLSGAFTGGVVVGSVSDSCGVFLHHLAVDVHRRIVVAADYSQLGKAQSELHGRHDGRESGHGGQWREPGQLHIRRHGKSGGIGRSGAFGDGDGRDWCTVDGSATPSPPSRRIHVVEAPSAFRVPRFGQECLTQSESRLPLRVGAT